MAPCLTKILTIDEVVFSRFFVFTVYKYQGKGNKRSIVHTNDEEKSRAAINIEEKDFWNEFFTFKKRVVRTTVSDS